MMYRARVGLYHPTAFLHNNFLRLSGYCVISAFLILLLCKSTTWLPVSILLFFLHSKHNCACTSCKSKKNLTDKSPELNLSSSASRILCRNENSSGENSKNILHGFQQKLLLLSGDIELNPGPPTQDLSVTHINTQSIRNKLDLIQAECVNFDIITVSETWLRDSDRDDSIGLIGFQNPIRLDRPNDPHGGVAIYLRNSLYCKHRIDLQIPHLEAVWVETKIGQESLLVGSFYRPPNATANYWNLIADSIRQANNTGLKFIVLGDFNTNWLDHPSNRLVEIINLFQMKQYIDEPTRITATSSTCLDLVLTPCHSLISRTLVLPEICSDHRVPCVHIKIPKITSKPFKRIIYNYNRLDQTKFNDLLSTTDWDNILSNNDVNDSAEIFTQTLFGLAKQCMPSKHITVRPQDAPWINEHIKFLIFEKNKIHKVAKQTNSPTNWAKFRKARNDLINQIRTRKSEYIKELDLRASDPNKLGNKEWWNLVKSFLSKKGMDSNNIPPIEHNGKIHYLNKDKAEILNNYFISQSKVLNENDPLPNITFLHNPLLRTICLTTIDVANVINSLKPNKAVGPDQIHNCILKAASSYIVEPITRFFNRCLIESKFPKPWKIAHITPLYKKGPKEVCSNYRPISLLSCVGKVFESCVHKYLLAFLTENNIITPSQSGFIPGDSTVNQLVSIYNDLCSSFDNALTTQAVFLDITKAFDRVWHRGLLHKLEAVGIVGPLLKWFSDYLSDREQSVVIHGEMSNFKTVPAGVPQGSVLGPLLFLIYINDIVDNIQSVIRLFADDTSLSLALENPQIRADVLNQDLIFIQEWSYKWKVTFNHTKTEVVNFIQGSDYGEQLVFEASNLESTGEHKHLGVVLQSNLKWDAHIHSIATKANMLISCLSSFKYRLGRKALETMYKSFIMPIFDYADVVWDSCTDTLSNVLEDLHLQALRIITGTVRGTSHQLLYNESGFCSLQDRRRRHKLILYKKILLGFTPNFLTELLPPLVSATNPYPRRRPQARTVPYCRTVTYSKSYFPSTTILWNDLPLNVQNSASISEFKRYLSNFDPVVPKYYYSGERHEQIIHCRLRLGMSDLNNDLYNRHLTLDRSCSCGFKIEDAHHYLLVCENYAASRRLTILTLPNEQQILSVILSGSPRLQLCENISVFKQVHEFIRQTKRFA